MPGTSPTLRAVIASIGLHLLAGCALQPKLEAAQERIVETASGRTLTRAELLARVRASRYVLLGELHDNPAHHARRGELLGELGVPATITAEHLTRGRRVVDGAPLPQALVDAGFDVRGWQWPMHEPLFRAVAKAGLPLSGANLPAATARQIARGGAAAVAHDLMSVLSAAPLSAPAQAALDEDLLESHCGHLPAQRLDGLRWAQRARDASMALALREARATLPGAEGGPAILLAGNGHLRDDYGVPQLLAVLEPRASLLTLAFVENEEHARLARTTHAWITAPVAREDPCEFFRHRSRSVGPAGEPASPGPSLPPAPQPR